MRLQHAYEALLADHARSVTVRDACNAALATLRDAREKRPIILATYEPDALEEWQRTTNTSLWTPFETALQESVAPRVKSIALDAIQKCILHGELLCEDPFVKSLFYNYPDMEYYQELKKEEEENGIRIRKQTADVVRLIRDAISGVVTDDVYLQAMKALQALVTSKHAQVHGKTLVDTLDVCVEITMSESHQAGTVPLATAKGSITQMSTFIVDMYEKIATKFVSTEKRKSIHTVNATYAQLLRPIVELETPYQLYQRDILLLLDRFVRFATVEDDEKWADKVNARVSLALDTLNIMLSKAGPLFINDDVLVKFIRDEVCVVVVKALRYSEKNTNPAVEEEDTLAQVPELSLALFHTLLSRFQDFR